MYLGLDLSLPALALRRAGGFSPASLFAAGEAGAWYDPSDLTTLFSDSAGTTPVATPGAGSAVTVGLMLDKSKGLTLGSELVTNGTFTTDTAGWSLFGGGSFVSDSEAGRLTPDGTTVAAVGTSFATTAGRLYKLELTVVGGAAGSAIRIGNSNNDASILGTTIVSGSITRYFFAATSTTWVTLRTTSSSAAVYTDWDNISVRELPGNHAYQTDSTKRPALSAKYNLLTYTEQFDNAAWSKVGFNAFGSGSVANTTATTDPLGGNTADFIQENTTTGFHDVRFTVAGATVGADYTFSFAVKAAGRTRVALGSFTFSATGYRGFDLSNGTTFSVAGGSLTEPKSFSISNLGDGWYRISVTNTAAGTSGSIQLYLISSGTSGSYTGDGVSGIYIWGADLRVANESSALPPYQRVVDALTYDTTGFPPYLLFDGSNDALVTNSIDFTATDEMSVFAGVRSLTGGTYGALVELSNNGDSNTGAFLMSGNGNLTTYRVAFVSRYNVSGNALANDAAYNPPATLIQTGLGDISGDSAILRVNAVQAAISTTDQGIGNYGNYPLYIGSRGGTTLPYNGRLYSLVVLGRGVTPTELTQTEGYVESKTFGKDMNYVLYEPVLGSDGDQITLTAGGDDLFVYQNYE
ncbi:MAG: hypothetical protein RL756_2287 [Pseudomonadota bacterium]|jgi:hypothetical protein